MRAGELDHKIIIESATTTADNYGQPIETWSAFATVWAKKRDLRGDEYFAAKQMTAKVDAVFTIRWLAGITEKMRLNHDGKYWDIRSVNELGRREGLDLYAEVRRS